QLGPDDLPHQRFREAGGAEIGGERGRVVVGEVVPTAGQGGVGDGGGGGRCGCRVGGRLVPARPNWSSMPACRAISWRYSASVASKRRSTCCPSAAAGLSRRL